MMIKNKHQTTKKTTSSLRELGFLNKQNFLFSLIGARKRRISPLYWNNRRQKKAIQAEAEHRKAKGLAYVHTNPIR